MDTHKRILQSIHYATIATTSEDGQPWNTPVFCALDAYTVYWGSHIDSQHSQNIRANGNVFIVIYDSTVGPGEGEGVYIKAHAEEITEVSEINHVHALLQNRRPVPYWKLEEVQAPAPVRLYKAIPEKIWMNDEGERDGYYIDIRTEVDFS